MMKSSCSCRDQFSRVQLVVIRRWCWFTGGTIRSTMVACDWSRLEGRTIRKVMGVGEFSSRRNFFSLSNSLYEFFKAIAWIFYRVNWRAWIFFLYFAPPPSPYKFSNGPSLTHSWLHWWMCEFLPVFKSLRGPLWYTDQLLSRRLTYVSIQASELHWLMLYTQLKYRPFQRGWELKREFDHGQISEETGEACMEST